MECDDGTEISSRFYNGREDGVMGSLATRGVFEGDRASVWEAVIVDLFPGGPARGIRPAARHRSRLALALSERGEISRGITAHQSPRSIAKMLGRSPSTVSREI